MTCLEAADNGGFPQKWWTLSVQVCQFVAHGKTMVHGSRHSCSPLCLVCLVIPRDVQLLQSAMQPLQCAMVPILERRCELQSSSPWPSRDLLPGRLRPGNIPLPQSFSRLCLQSAVEQISTQFLYIKPSALLKLKHSGSTHVKPKGDTIGIASHKLLRSNACLGKLYCNYLALGYKPE